MSSTFQSTTLVQSKEIFQSNNNHYLQMRPDIPMWLGQDEFSPFSNSSGDVNDILFQDCSSVDCSSNYSSLMTGVPSFELINHNQQMLENCNGYVDYSLCNYDQLKDTSSNVAGCYQTCDHRDVGNIYSMYPNNLSSNIYDIGASQQETWGFEGHTIIPSCGSQNSRTKVGRYSVEERRDRILRYLKKRNQRNFRKTIKYACRKTLADRRVRIRGRFAKNQDEELLSNQDESMTFAYFDCTKSGEYSDQVWLQEAMEALMPDPPSIVVRQHGRMA